MQSNNLLHSQITNDLQDEAALMSACGSILSELGSALVTRAVGFRVHIFRALFRIER